MFLKILKLKRFWLTLIFLSPFIYIAICEANKAYWDAYVDRQCEKYGGLTVVKQIEISREGFEALPRNKNGEVVINDDNNELISDSGDRSSFKFFGVEVASWEVHTKDAKSGDIAGIHKAWVRSGGDAIFTVSGPSSHICSYYASNPSLRLEEIFNIKD